MTTLERTEPASSALTGMLAGFTAAGLVVAAAVPPALADDGPVLCPFRLATGLECPGCGLTRSWIALVHGDVRHSLAEHPLGWAFLLGGVALMLAAVLAVVRRQPLPPPTRVVGRIAPAVVFVATVAFGVARLVTEVAH